MDEKNPAIEELIAAAREMVNNTWEQHNHFSHDSSRRLRNAVYKVEALAAAPQPPAQVGEDAVERAAVAALDAILGGYDLKLERGHDDGWNEDYAFLTVENPEYEEDNGKDPQLVIDVRKLRAALAAAAPPAGLPAKCLLLPVLDKHRATFPLPTGNFAADEAALAATLTAEMIPAAPTGYAFVEWQIAPPDDVFALFEWTGAGLLTEALEALRSLNIHEEAETYEHREPDYTPTERERALLEDFGEGLRDKISDFLTRAAGTKGGDDADR